jgi:hypothetical protein
VVQLTNKNTFAHRESQAMMPISERQKIVNQTSPNSQIGQ